MSKKVLCIATTMLLIIGMFQLSGISVRADETPAPSPTSSSDPMPSPPLDTTVVQVPSSIPHEHYFVTVELQAPTMEQNGMIADVCTGCNEVRNQTVIPAGSVYIKKLYGAIKEAEDGSTIIFDAKSWLNITDYVIEILKEKKDVTVVINYVKDGGKYQVTIPANLDYLALSSDKWSCYSWEGFCRDLGIDAPIEIK